jgi:hypothetical protein
MEAIKIKGETVLLQENVILLSFNDEQSQTVSLFAKVKADPQSIYNAAAALFELHPELLPLFALAISEAARDRSG